MDSDDVSSTSTTTYGDYDYGYVICYHPDHYDTSPPYLTSHYTYFNEIILSVFGIAAVCVGLPCLIWAFYSVHLQRKASGRVSAFIILLLLNDLLQLLLYPYIVSFLLSFVYSSEHHMITVVSACVKIIGLHLHSIVALEAALTVKYPRISARMCSWPCYIMISIIILLIPVMFVFGVVFGDSSVRDVYLYLTYGSFLLPACSLVATGKIIYKAMPTVTDSRPGAMVFAVSLVTLLVLYFPSVILLIVKLHYHISDSWMTMTLCLVSLTVISEPLLCVLVCRQNLRAQTKQEPLELISEHSEFNI